MPKSKSKARKRSQGGQRRSGTGGLPWGGKAGAEARRNNLVIAAILAVGLIAGGVYWGRSVVIERGFLALAAQGQDRLAAVETRANHGGGHLSPGAAHVYAETIPTSGIHDATPIMPGFYDRPQRPTRLVHSLEHGNIIVYYERLDPEATRLMRDWIDLYDGKWDGLIAAPLPGLGEQVVLAAWTRLLRLEQFDGAAAAAFIDRFRGRGPERPVR